MKNIVLTMLWRFGNRLSSALYEDEAGNIALRPYRGEKLVLLNNDYNKETWESDVVYLEHDIRDDAIDLDSCSDEVRNKVKQQIAVNYL